MALKCCVPILTKDGTHECGRVAHRFVGRKGYCSTHTAEAFRTQTKERKLDSAAERHRRGDDNEEGHE